MSDYIEYNGKKYRKCTKEELKLKDKARNEASKPANFSTMYGGGVNATAAAITKAFPKMPENEVRERARKVIKSKKGERVGRSNNYKGGAWSGAFNMMAQIALESEIPELPLLKSQISTALRPKAVGDDFTTGRKNWAIQGSGSEFLAAFLTMSHWLVDYYEIDALFVISVHDEIAWMVKEDQAHLMVAIFQQAHFLVWTLLHYQMGLYELPIQRAYFSGVAIDNRVRKSPDEKTVTPSNPDGVNEPPGKEYTIRETVENGWVDQLLERKQDRE